MPSPLLRKPDVQLVAITIPGQPVAIMHFIVEPRVVADGNGRLRNGRVEPTDANLEAEVKRTFPNATGWRRINRSDIPADRSVRDAWTDKGNAIAEDAVKAAAIRSRRP